MAEPQISCTFVATQDSPEHIRVAEDLGYARAWLADTPQQSPDVWLMLALAARKTVRIGLGPAVLVPSLRHPMVNATQTQSLQLMAPDRVAVAFGTGFTGRYAMGYRPLTWNYVVEYVRAYRGLLTGETVEWEGARMRMLPPQRDPPLRLDLPPILLAAAGPKGARCAEALGVDGIMAVGRPAPDMKTPNWVAIQMAGTVLDTGEDVTSARVRAAAGPALAAIYHVAYELGGADAIRAMPGGEDFIAVIERAPAEDRHFAVHQGHMVRMNDADLAAWRAGSHILANQLLTIGPAETIARAITDLASLGVTEVIYRPVGTNIARELEHFMAAAVGARTR
jgi:5,10-methylenetetrahydromethanopterin reductase